MNATQLTMNLLLQISHHLSTRSQCKDTNYEVVITRNAIAFQPDIKVFPNVHKRRHADKETVVGHVIKYHFSDELLVPDADGAIHWGYHVIKADKLIPGTYVYRSSIDGKRRKWFRK